MHTLQIDQSPITSLAIQPNNQNIFISTNKGKIYGWSIKDQKREMILPQFGTDAITQITFTNLNMELYAIDSNGAVLRYFIYENKLEEWRIYSLPGDYRIIQNPQDDSFYLIGHKNLIEKWSII